MKQKLLNAAYKKQKFTKHNYEKNNEKSPEKNPSTSISINKLTQSIDITKKIKLDRQNSSDEKRLKSKSKKHERTIFSHSPNYKNRKTETKNKKTPIIEHYLKNCKSSNMIKINTKSKKANKKDNEKEEQQNLNPNLYGFNLYKHVKENLRNKDRLCHDPLTKETLYCIDCKMSTCQKCRTFNVHKGHNLVPKYLYYESNGNALNEVFKNLDNLFKENPSYLNISQVKEELKNTLISSIDNIIKNLTEIKQKKLKELEKLFENTEGNVEALKKKEAKMKNDLIEFIKNQKEFFCIEFADEKTKEKININKNNDLDADVDVLKNLQTNSNNIGMIETNKDELNSTFLVNYDLLKNTSYINGEILSLLKDIEINKEKYLTDFNEKIKIINIDVEKLLEPFNGIFNYCNLNKEFYKMVYDKIQKYDEKIIAMKKYIYDMVNKNGNFEQIDKDNRVSETHIKQRFDNIMDYQLTDKDEAATVKSKSTKQKNLHRLSLYFTQGAGASEKLKDVLKNMGNSNNISNNISHNNLNTETNKNIYEKPEDIKLNKGILQKYFSYETYNTIHNYFRYKPKKKKEEDYYYYYNNVIEEIDEDIEVAKPIPGTNEIQLYDRKTNTIIKKIVKFDKQKHKYLYFLNGFRTVLIKDCLYILGGVDKEKKTTKVAWCYNIKTNELKVLPDMLKNHAYHSVEYLDYYKSIIVLGGENCAYCELYDLNTGCWRGLPDMNVPRAHCNSYLDKFTHIIYTFFGVVGDITEKNNYTDVIECLEFKRLAYGWTKIDYNNKAEMNFKSGFNKIFPLSSEMILIYGAKNTRDFMKKAAVYLTPKFEIVKIDNKIFKEIKESSKNSKKLSKILSCYM